MSLTKIIRHLPILFLLCSFAVPESFPKDLHIIGRVTDPSQTGIDGANVTLAINSNNFSSTTDPEGYYVLTIPDNLAVNPKKIEIGLPYPNPFTNSVSLPVVTRVDGNIDFAIYDLAGRKVSETLFTGIKAGSYRINWNGQVFFSGIYIYAITFHGKTYSGRLMKTGGISDNQVQTGIEPYIFPPKKTDNQDDLQRIGIIATVSKSGYHTTRLTDISLAIDTILNFIIYPRVSLPFKTSEGHIAVLDDDEYKKLLLKGINLGVSPPGYFPGEVAYAISPGMYERWIRMMAESGFNSIRVYTLHPPVFYEILAGYNLRHPDKPLYLFQGIWLDEIEDGSMSEEYDLNERITDFITNIREVINCMHGNNTIAFRPGKAYGEYVTDISPWIAGYIIGREIAPQEVDSTNKFHPEITSFTGTRFSISGASASEVFITRMLDETANFEINNYSVSRPVSCSSWPTLDPLVHPTEIFTDEDKASIDITKISETDGAFRLFASYHAYPYYPDFISNEPAYRTYTDEQGPNSYLGYLTALKNHYSNIPLVIAEFGVPSSWGSAHQSFSGMHHGGLSEIQQGNYNIRLFNNIVDSGGAGGFMFSWMDEWFKRTWIVQYLEAYGIKDGETLIPTRQLWHNLASPEQNFGLIAFDQTAGKSWTDYNIVSPGNSLKSIRASHDNSYFYLSAELNETSLPGDTLIIAFDTYLRDTGESVLPGGYAIQNRSEFYLECIKGEDTASLFVTEAYNMCGLTSRFNLSDTTIQKYKSTNTDGAPWVLSKWINNGFENTIFDLGKLPSGSTSDFIPGERQAVVWSGSYLLVRIPWTLLQFYDPTHMIVNDGAVTYDSGKTYEIIGKISDGIAVTILFNNKISHTLTRYSWPSWLIVPETKERVKKSLGIISTEMRNIPDFIF